MPAFNLAPIEDESAFEPVVPTAPAAGGGGGGAAAPAKKPKPTKAQMNQRLESAAGPLKPLAQFMNALGSPDVKAGIVTGPINAISKLGNAIGDLVQGKPFRNGRNLSNADWSAIDANDAWKIPDATARALNPFRIGPNYGEVTPADQAGMQLGGAIGGEIVGAVTGTSVVRRLGQLSQVKRAADAIKATRAVRGLAVAQRANPALRTGVSVTQNVGQALLGTTAAVPFIDMDQNLANLGDAFGLRLPGRAEDDDNYLTRVGKGLLVEGLAAPLSVIGAASFVPALRKAMFGGPTFLDDLADAELEPYMYRGTDAPPLPPGAGVPQLPSTQMQAAAGGGPITPVRIEVDAPGGPLPGTPPDAPALPTYQPGGAMVPTTPNGSAIERYLDEATQIRQVESQRQRLQSMGLIEQGEAGQLGLRVATGNPEARAQIEQLATQRGQLLAQVPNVDEATAKQLLDQIDQIDQEVADLNLSGTTEEFLAPRGSRQGELDLDTRPELDTFLAQLDELDDSQLREIHSRVLRQAGEARNAQELTATQAQIEGLNQKLAEIEARQAAGEITPRGAKGQLTRVQRELAMAEQQLQAVQQRLAAPETLVGDQLEMTLPQQLGLNLAPEIELPPMAMVARGPGEYGYRTPDDYRSALEGWPRDLLRRLAMPDSSPEVAALVKARTGRRVWSAKRSDIIDALVELSQRRGMYLPPTAEQLTAPLTTNMAGAADAPLLDVPADLSTSSPMGRVMDADGNEVPVPMAEFQPRGMDAATREQLKAEILRRAIDNGEVQAPVTPIPNRPEAPDYFQQSTFVDDLFSDETGQLAMAFNADALPPYKAGGKNADALLDEMRLRFEYNLLDAKAMQAKKDAWMAANGWDRLSWEEQKRLGLMGRGMFRMSADDLPSPMDVVRPPTPGFEPELPVAGARAPQPYRGDGVETPQFTPELQPKPERKPAVYDTKSVYVSINGEAVVMPKEAVPTTPAPKGKGKGKAKAATTAEAQAAKQALADIPKARAELAKQLEELRKKSQGGSC
jgi:hypothetical protein